jgi:hypothetical protein
VSFVSVNAEKSGTVPSTKDVTQLARERRRTAMEIIWPVVNCNDHAAFVASNFKLTLYTCEYPDGHSSMK